MYEDQKVAAVLVAAGRSVRMGFDKLFYRIGGREVFLHAVDALDQNPLVDTLVVVAGENRPQIEKRLAEAPLTKPYVVVTGGETRAQSVMQGVAACPDADIVAIHDAARPFASQALITRVIQAGGQNGAAAPAIPLQDTVKQVKEGEVESTPPRGSLMAVQTPQVFDRKAFAGALAAVLPGEYAGLTDDCMVMERAGHKVALVEGDPVNRKITTQHDLESLHASKRLRVGTGYDVHKLVTGRQLILGGVVIPYQKGLLGHSDADVLVHAVMDALLGAAAMGDIGTHFPDTDPAYEGVSSITLLGRCGELLNQSGYKVENIDATVVCQAPKLAPRIGAMRRNIAKTLEIPLADVNLKATTEEGLGFTGTGEGVAAHCVVLLAEA